MTRRGLRALLALACLAAPLAPAPAAGRTLLHEDRTVAAVDERPIRFYLDRPDIAEKMPLLVVVDGSGCSGQLRPSSWGNYAPTGEDAVPYARLMVEKPGVGPTDVRPGDCPDAFNRDYTIDNRVTDHLRVLQHIANDAPWWDGRVLLWGWSDGGDVAARLVTYRPDIERAVLGAMGGGLTMAEHFEDIWVCPEATTPDRAACLADLRADFARIEDNPSGAQMWNGESYATWASRFRARLSAPLSDNRVPILIVHGELDQENTPVESARKLVADLRASGNEAFTYWEIAGMGHGWNDLPPARQVAIHRAMLDWLLTGTVAPERQALALTGEMPQP